MRLTQLLDTAALTLYEGFLTTELGNRGAVIAVLLVTAAFPDSLGFCFWLGLGLHWWVLPVELGVSSAQFAALAVALVVVGLVGLMFNLRKMAARPQVRGFAAQHDMSSLTR